MPSVKIPAWPKGVAGNVWANKLASASLYMVESDLLNFDTGIAVNIFSIPEETILTAVGIEVVTATTGPGSIVVQDTARDLITFGANLTDDTGFTLAPVLQRYAKLGGVNAPGKQARALQVDVNGLTAGTFRIWIQFKPNRVNIRTIDASL